MIVFLPFNIFFHWWQLFYGKILCYNGEVMTGMGFIFFNSLDKGIISLSIYIHLIVYSNFMLYVGWKVVAIWFDSTVNNFNFTGIKGPFRGTIIKFFLCLYNFQLFHWSDQVMFFCLYLSHAFTHPNNFDRIYGGRKGFCL